MLSTVSKVEKRLCTNPDSELGGSDMVSQFRDGNPNQSVVNRESRQTNRVVLAIDPEAD